MMNAAAILRVLDAAAEAFTFPALDNGYIYLAATRLSCYRSQSDWALVVEVFGFSPRAGLPDTCVYTFASSLHNRDGRDQYISDEAYRAYLAKNPNNESRFVYPVEEGAWLDADDTEAVAESATAVVLRGQETNAPTVSDFARLGIELEAPPRVRVYELCRALADMHRDLVLATPAERRVSVAPEMIEILQLEEWRHPDVTGGELPSTTNCFRQLADVLASADASRYRPTVDPNTHWVNWPDAGTL